MSTLILIAFVGVFLRMSYGSIIDPYWMVDQLHYLVSLLTQDREDISTSNVVRAHKDPVWKKEVLFMMSIPLLIIGLILSCLVHIFRRDKKSLKSKD